MEKEKLSNVSLVDIGGQPAVAWGADLHNREERYEDSQAADVQQRSIPSTQSKNLIPSENDTGYLLLPNIDTPVKLLLAMEKFEWPLISQTIIVSDVNRLGVSASDYVTPEALLNACGVQNKTRTAKANAKDAINRWCYEKYLPDRFALPIIDLVAMIHDLRAVISLLIFASNGTCTIEKLKQNTEGGLKMFAASLDDLSYYKKHIDDAPRSTKLFQYEYESRIAPSISLKNSNCITDVDFKYVLREFCDDLITAMMSSLRPVFTYSGFYAAGENASLDGAYAFWASEAFNGKAAVCEYCGNLFLRKRSDARFCSDNCRVKAHKKSR